MFQKSAMEIFQFELFSIVHLHSTAWIPYWNALFCNLFETLVSLLLSECAAQLLSFLNKTRRNQKWVTLICGGELAHRAHQEESSEIVNWFPYQPPTVLHLQADLGRKILSFKYTLMYHCSRVVNLSAHRNTITILLSMCKSLFN